MIELVPEDLLPAAELALKEGRLHYRNTDKEGRPCNGGQADPLQVGEWSEPFEPILCKSGWHVTDDPLRWKGERVWLVEGLDCGGSEGDKHVYRQIRPLAEVNVETCLDERIRARLGAKDLLGADLRGANLPWANLSGANLSGANLPWANLRRAYLPWANLRRADLRRADLSGADLRRADLRGADLFGADLRGAYLTWANLRGADLSAADLSGADLSGANLRGADLFRANLSGVIR